MFALIYICDALCYLSALGFWGLLSGTPEAAICAPFVLGGVCALMHALRNRPAWLRLAPMPLALACLPLLGGGRAGALRLLAPAAYLYHYVRANDRAADHYYQAQRFRIEALALGFLLLAALGIHPATWRRGVAPLFLFLTLSVYVLRALRHEAGAASGPRFAAMNLLSVTLVCALGLLLGQPAALRALGTLWGAFVDHLLVPVLSAVLFVLEKLLYALFRLFEVLFGKPDAAFPILFSGEMIAASPSDAETPLVRAAINPWIRRAATVLGAAVLCAIILWVARIASRRILALESDRQGVTEERAPLDEQRSSRAARRRARRGRGIVGLFARALDHMAAHGGAVTGTMNVSQLVDANRDRFDASALETLRETFLPVRYGGRDESAPDVRRAQDALDRIRKRP